MRVDLFQLKSNKIVCSNHNGVNGAEGSVLIGTRLSGKETIDIFSGSNTTLIRLVQFEWKQWLQSELLKNREHFELPPFECSQILKGFLRIGINCIAIEDG